VLSHVRGSLWFVPVLCVGAGVALSFATLWIDGQTGYTLIPQSLTGGPDASLSILAAVATSMVSLAALVLNNWRCSTRRSASASPSRNRTRICRLTFRASASPPEAWPESPPQRGSSSYGRVTISTTSEKRSHAGLLRPGATGGLRLAFHQRCSPASAYPGRSGRT
jgi:hypothetical protein